MGVTPVLSRRLTERKAARLPLPGPEAGSLDLPIAGETTVIPSYEILCLLNAVKLEGHVDLSALTESEGRSCDHA